jgi:WD40 repeat protein
VFVVSGDEGHTHVRVGDPATGERVASFTEVYPERMYALPRADGTDALLAVDGAVGVTCWDPATGTPLTERLVGHVSTDPYHDEVLAVQLSGSVLVTGGRDGTLRRWDLPVR